MEWSDVAIGAGFLLVIGGFLSDRWSFAVAGIVAFGIGVVIQKIGDSTK